VANLKFGVQFAPYKVLVLGDKSASSAEIFIAWTGGQNNECLLTL